MKLNLFIGEPLGLVLFTHRMRDAAMRVGIDPPPTWSPSRRALAILEGPYETEEGES